MKMYDQLGRAQHEIIEHIGTLFKLLQDFKGELQVAPGIDFTDEFFKDTYATFSGLFNLANGDRSTPVTIKANVVGPDSNTYITGNGTSDLDTLVGALTENYTIEGDGSQIPASEVVLVIKGGTDAELSKKFHNTQQARYGDLIDTVAGNIKTFYDGVDKL